ncbi:VCBS repeat-containing protein [Lysobacter sp. KIS68-7]|uniref:FG-GAP repeat domain-containing protein n=1 Tax=Lysobacter sp. KIS68-7 TaxID=2904252 RepID=UPI001E4D42D1|nr:VCBS repeat-containing protein [Lysobacter sp. KIS68-7]UHQ20220.1 VCBS repeat-containing protein [Lysobacter sp. KIS68-7]
MNRPRQLAAMTLALSGIAGLAHGAALPHNDLDGDGRSDIVWRNVTTGEIVYWSAGNAAWIKGVRVTRRGWNLPGDFSLAESSSAIPMRLEEWYGPMVGVMVESKAGYYVGLAFNYERKIGYEAFYDSSVLAPEWKLVGTGDFGALRYRDDFDFGVDDLVFRNQRDGRNMLSFRGWDRREYMDITPVGDLRWNVAGIGDFDGDGNADLLWRNFGTGRNAIWPAADSARSIAMTPVPDLAWKVAAIADFNGDGRADIFWRNASSGMNVIWESGNGATPRAAVRVPDQAWQIASVGDFDGDGKSDLLWRNQRTGANVLWKAANAGTPQTLPGVTNPAWRPLM